MPRSCFYRIVGALSCAALCLGAAGGCGRATTQYYFAAADLDEPGKDGKPPDNPSLTFYRVTFDAQSFGVRSSLQQGFYDAEALHQLFGQVAAPQQGEDPDGEGDKDADGVEAGSAGGDTVRSGSYTLRYDPEHGTWRVVEHRDRFTIMYGANADAMAEQVQSFAENDATGERLGKFLKSTVERDRKKEPKLKPDPNAKALRTAQTGANQIAGRLDKSASGLAAGATPARTRGALMRAAQDLLRSLGRTEKLEADPNAAMKRAEELYTQLSGQE